MKIKRKNGSNRYVVRIMHLLEGILTFLLIIIIEICGLYFMYDEWLFLSLDEKITFILLLLSAILIFFFLIIFIVKPYFIIDFNKNIIKIKKEELPLNVIFKIEYFKNDPFFDKIIVYKYNGITNFIFYTGRYDNIEKSKGYPMAKKIEEINNKLQEYRKQNNLD